MLEPSLAKQPKLEQKETTIHVDFNGKSIPLSKHDNNPRNWCKIYFDEFNQFDGYMLGKIVLKLILEEPNTHQELQSDFNRANIAQHFPGIDAIRIQAADQSAVSRNKIEIRTRRRADEYTEVKHFTYNYHKLNLPPALFGKPGKLDVRKIFKIEFEKFDAIYKEIILQVKVYASAIKGDISYVEETAPDMIDAIPVLDYYFLNKRKDPANDTSLTQYRSSNDAQRFFALIRDYHSYEMRPNSEHSVQDPRLIPQLLDYQKEAVIWMLAREGVCDASDDDSTDQLQKLLSDQINKRINLKAFGNKCPQDAYYSRTSGCLSWNKEPIERLPNRGGILADEMGLGKTIELLSLILLNPRLDATGPNIESNNETTDGVNCLSFECPCGGGIDQQERGIVTCSSCGISQHSVCVGFGETGSVEATQNYLCPFCIENLRSKSTLIVVPNSILKQWEDEIANNVSEDLLKVFVYSGIPSKYVHPFVLSQYDIVLTTYEVLRREIHFTASSEVKRFRDRKRYPALPCPLILIEWWRVCLDEAQMVENVNWSFAKVACMIPAVHRWCVTGTPIQNHLQDLYGVVCFLGIEPINDIKWWEFLIMEPFRLNNCQIPNISKIFGKIFWRTEKEDIQDQLRLPRQTEVIHRLEFAPAEKYFYEQRSIFWIEKFKTSIGNIERDQPISALSANQLLPFRRLRYVCTHPQLDEEAFEAVDIFIERGARLTLTVPEFVEWLVKRVTAKCVKRYKLRVAALNALAGLHLLKLELDDACRQYKCVLALAEQNKDRWNTDDINLLHALVNLSKVIKKLGNGDGQAWTLDIRVDEVIKKLVQKKSNELTNTANAITRKEIDGNFGTNDDAWWIRAVEHMSHADNVVLLQEFVHKFRNLIPFEFMSENEQPPLNTCAFVTNLQTTLQRHLLEIFTTRAELFSDWMKIHESRHDAAPSYLKMNPLNCDHFVIPTNPAISTNATADSSCAVCCFDSKLSHYESLFSRKSEDRVMKNVKTMKSLTECTLNAIYEFAKKNQFCQTLLADGRLHILQFRDLQNEIHRFWKWYDKMNDHDTALYALIGETKPIDNATTAATSASQRDRMSARRLNMSSLDPVHIVPRIQLQTLAVDQSKKKFNDCLRELHYVKGLQMYGYSCDGSIVDINPKKCSVHHATQKWGFLPCRHFFCANCFPLNDRNEFNCPVSNCWMKFKKEVIRFIDMQSGSKHTVTNIPTWKVTDKYIWRSPFTKIEGVIRTLLTIGESHPNDKALVICTCDPMLKVFAAEFDQNAISYVLYDKLTKDCREKLLRYRTDSTRVLLMPLAVASTGLNLTEANHVLLVEPCPNLAIEEQAIGRIHRLGQKKPTFVHRFYVTDTIEEKLVRMDKEKKMSTFEEGNMTIQDMLDILDDNLLRNEHYL